MNERRVVVTGIGTVCCNGTGKEVFWQSLIDGISKIDCISYFDPSSFHGKVAGEARDFDPAQYIDPKEAKRMGRFTQFAIAATKLALEDGKLTITDEISSSVGALVGSCFCGLPIFGPQRELLQKRGPGKVSPFFIPMLIGNITSGQISIHFNAKGPNYNVVSACATGAHCIGRSYDLIRYGTVDAMITGATDASVDPLIMAGFGNMKALTRNSDPKTASRPFDKNRDGFVMAEGAAVLLLESLESAKARGVEIYGEIAGYAMNADANHITSPDPEGSGAKRAMELAIKSAGLKAEDIDYISAHGTSTLFNDRIETLAIKRAFGDHAKKLAISSIKSIIGHTMGAAGALAFASALLTIKNGIIPPTINYETPDPDCDLDYVPNKARHQKVNVAMSNSFGFGGTNAVLIAKKFVE